MRPYDFSPLLRSPLGFERLARLRDGAVPAPGIGRGLPPYNIAAVDENHYQISIAVAGFGKDDLSIEADQQSLRISGKMAQADDDGPSLHPGMAARAFSQKFALAEHVEVTGAHLENGLLTIDLERQVPEAKKPRTIKIGAAAPESLLEKAKKLLAGEVLRKAA